MKKRLRRPGAFITVIEEQTVTREIAALIRRLEGRIRSYGSGRAIVAFSGGVDSAVVLSCAVRALGATSVTAVTALSPSYPAGELEQARRVARSLGVQHRTVETSEVQKEHYARNDAMRCFHCKTELYSTLKRLASTEYPDAVILAGANADDVSDFRPGLRAADRHEVRNPLLEEGLGKRLVRAVAGELQLEVAEKPALACLASRVAYGIRVTPDLLERIDRAEQAIRALGFPSVRMRHFGELAKIELPAPDIVRFIAHPRREEITALLRSLGWNHITLDLEGQRSGSMNPPVRFRVKRP